MDVSFCIESKWFAFKRKGGNFFSLSEKSGKATQSLHIPGSLINWLAMVLEDRSKRLSQTFPFSG